MRYPTKKQIRNVGRKAYKATGLVNPMKKGQLSLTRVLKDVNKIKTMLNAEKKRFVQQTSETAGQLIGQVGINTSGHFIADITPLVPIGAGNGQRNGSSIKPHSMFMEMQFTHQANTAQKMRFELEIFEVRGSVVSNVNTSAVQLYNGNQFISAQNSGVIILDTMASRDQDYFKNYKRIYKKNFYIDPDNFTNQAVLKYLKIGIKFNKNYHIKYNDDGNIPTAGQLLLMIRADSGNTNSTVSTLNGVSVKGASTACTFNYNNTYYFYDN